TEKAYPSLDGGYTNFGKVEDEASQKVVQAIGATQVPNTETPSEKITVTGFEIVQ
ncbi:MAG: hypothetical protein K0S20_532, partial [Patescibacteria group bacterium]|nr:hypothetical protein [Patescibacteria group bacterium]